MEEFKQIDDDELKLAKQKELKVSTNVGEPKISKSVEDLKPFRNVDGFQFAKDVEELKLAFEDFKSKVRWDKLLLGYS
ncbi:hypothetical protein AQUCO_12100002v1 [Aquilegia coerulea]|uniref:Uncharacterized protein n=1 Tax=Aquilegia coerulea TaxID=218851 RepID=A0A2G5C1W9_AQUCA|nr:hypothetical protein AQUCO_12100002v1 [Aquilegia coerulea]